MTARPSHSHHTAAGHRRQRPRHTGPGQSAQGPGLSGRATRRANRRGRDLRGDLVPQQLPAWRSKREKFDSLVLEALSPIDQRWHDHLLGLDIAVDDVPRMQPLHQQFVQWPPEVTADGPVPLARLVHAGVDVSGRHTRARVVLFRRPLEDRAEDADELVDLLHHVLVRQIATYLGLTEEAIDPEGTTYDY